MIVWGGFREGGGTLADGARYNPTTDTWTPLAPAPLEGRADPTAVWTGREMIVFGGVSFNPASVPSGMARGMIRDGHLESLANHGAPGSRWGHTAVWLDG
jgi:hypothetical protein